MPRDRATIFTAIWSDADFRSLTSAEQRLYFLLNTHSTLSYAGVADWRPGRLAKTCSDMTADDVRATGSALQAKRFIFIDDESEEVLVRSYIRHDGVLNHPKLSISFVNAYAAVASPEIQGILVHELNRLRDEYPEWRAFAESRVLSILKQPRLSIDEATNGSPINTATVAPEPLGEPMGQPLGQPMGQGLGQPLEQPLGFGLPTATTTTTSSSETRGGGSRRRPETALPHGWRPNSKHAEKARELGLDLNEQSQAFRFHAESHDRRLRNWDAGFNQWLAKAKQFAEERGDYGRGGGGSQWDLARQWNTKRG